VLFTRPLLLPEEAAMHSAVSFTETIRVIGSVNWPDAVAPDKMARHFLKPTDNTVISTMLSMQVKRVLIVNPAYVHSSQR
jgi:hypothetical protein